MSKEYLNLFANCIPVKGYKRSIICDLQRQQYKFIPNSLFFLLQNEFSKMPVNDIFEKYENKIVNEYIEFLLENEFVFWSDKESRKRFPELNLEWDFPALISNSIIDIKEKKYRFKNLFNQLENLGCKYIQIRFFKKQRISEIDQIIKELEGSIIKSVQLLIPFSADMQINKIIGLTKKHLRINSILINGAPFERIIERTKGTNAFIFFRKQEFNSCHDCGSIKCSSFLPSLKLFSEAQNYNTCLNRKLSIDENGQIKNCPSSPVSYGNIESTPIDKVVKDTCFQRFWLITKDLTEICKDCEFRYICIDCRIYLKNPDNIYSKPLKCNYDPYTASIQTIHDEKFD
jgi:SPASM domain peptide maturase of grasp-with-spasm system